MNWGTLPKSFSSFSFPQTLNLVTFYLHVYIDIYCTSKSLLQKLEVGLITLTLSCEKIAIIYN